MKANRVFFSGILGGILLSLFTAYFRGVAGWIEWNFEMTVGTLFTRPDLNAFIIGLVGHLLLAGGFALVYGLLFETFKKAGAFMGLAVGLLHALVIGLLLGALPFFHAWLGTGLAPNPGIFAMNYGTTDVIFFFLLHLFYGGIIGALYGTPLRLGDPTYARVRPSAQDHPHGAHTRDDVRDHGGHAHDDERDDRPDDRRPTEAEQNEK